MKKKILFVSNTSWSIYKFRYEYILKLKKNFNCYIFTPDNLYKKKIKNVKLFSSNKNELIFTKLYKIFKRENFNHVIVYSFKMQLIIAIISIFKKLNLIFLIAGRGSLFIEKKKLLYQKLLTIFYRIIVNFILLFPKKLIFINPYDKKFFLENFYLRQKHIFQIPTEGITVSKKFRYKVNKKKNFIFFARVIKEKGIFEYSKAIRLINTVRNNKYNFFYAGPRNNHSSGSSLIFQCEKKINSLKNNKELKYLGNKKNFVRTFRKMDCLIAPSYTEGAGKSVMEAMLSGLFIIASNVSGHKYILSNTGNIIIENNPKEIISAIAKLEKLSSNKLIKFQKKAFDKLKSKFSTDRVYKQLVRIFNI